jgi:fructose-specific component phosphotransferase system IIB-like protein
VGDNHTAEKSKMDLIELVTDFRTHSLHFFFRNFFSQAAHRKASKENEQENNLQICAGSKINSHLLPLPSSASKKMVRSKIHLAFYSPSNFFASAIEHIRKPSEMSDFSLTCK